MTRWLTPIWTQLKALGVKDPVVDTVFDPTKLSNYSPAKPHFAHAQHALMVDLWPHRNYDTSTYIIQLEMISLTLFKKL